MFDTLKIYTHKEVSLAAVTDSLIQLGYTREKETDTEGDFSVHGDTLELFPANFSFPVRIEWEFDTIEKIYSFDKELKKKIISYDFLIVIPRLKKARRYSESLPLDAILRVKKGDYVVHVTHGIGKFLGSKKMEVKDGFDYFFEIEYAGGDCLYVGREDAHLIQKYTNLSLRPPQLNRLGTRDWLRTKQRAEKGIKNFAWELLRREAQRAVKGGRTFPKDSEWQGVFESLFPYALTEDQIRAIKDVKADMESNLCTDRLICGDVGFGKTEVAMRAVFKAVMGNAQVAFLVPTTILAYQHYMNLAARLRDFPIEVEMLSRFRTRGRQQRIIKEVAQGRIDVIVGTHRLLSDDVAFKNLGFLVIDEEQRFGVAHKEKIKELRAGIEVITLTATPIPRTLYMSLIGIKSISLIKTPPKDRRAVKTHIIEFKPSALKDIIMHEAVRGGQVFFIHNRIETISRIYKKLKAVLPEKISIGLVHGRLSSKDIEKAMVAFIKGKIDVLLSTAIVESGIDIPRANTIIINDAHTFGLSDLHQLRGRVGRYTVQAHAYLVVPRLSGISSDAHKRLRLVEEFSHLGSGFDVAMSDLELRGAGNILGRQQHGFIWMVGFDLYCRLLKKEIEYLKEIKNQVTTQ